MVGVVDYEFLEPMEELLVECHKVLVVDFLTIIFYPQQSYMIRYEPQYLNPRILMVFATRDYPKVGNKLRQTLLTDNLHKAFLHYYFIQIILSLH
jgi:hypothetical protein